MYSMMMCKEDWNTYSQNSAGFWFKIGHFEHINIKWVFYVLQDHQIWKMFCSSIQKNENVDDKVIALEDETVSGVGLTASKIGVQFKEEKEVYDFYASYAYAIGFWVRKKSSMSDDDVVLRFSR